MLSVVGKGSGLSFTVQIAEGASEIALDEPHTVNVQGDEVSVFQFIPPQGISDKQLDVTATSQSNLAAYLKVSHICEDVQENLEVVDYKKESLRLSFATKGRITYVLIDCCDYMVLDFRQQLKNALKNVEMSWLSKWGERVYTRLLLVFNIRSLKKNIILPCFHHDDHFQHLL